MEDKDPNKWPLNKQEYFWKHKIATDYIEDNSFFLEDLGKQAWITMLGTIDLNSVHSIADLGSNIGRNVKFLKAIHETPSFYAYDINCKALEALEQQFPDVTTKCCSLLSLHSFELPKVDLVFTSQVLIHIAPENLEKAMRNIYNLSNKYILISEYFNRTPTYVNYRGESDVLFKRDFGSMFLDLFQAKCLGYGFLWGREYDSAGFDDVTYWVFEKLE